MSDDGVEVEELSWWADMPAELLRDVLMRIEESESTWRRRNTVVACAAVCTTWRHIIKDIVQTLQLSGKLTFPISLKQPGPRSSWIQCFIKRNRGMQTYHLYLNLTQASNDDGKFLLAARRCRRPTYTDYIISLKSDDVLKGSSNYFGKLRSNFLGTKFTIYDTATSRSTTRQVSPSGNYPVAHASYELNVLGSRGPRRMQCVVDVDAIGASQVPANLDVFRSKSTCTDAEEALVLRNKAPRWHEQLQCWCLNFNGRVTVASVKNFQLVAGDTDSEDVVLQFGKVGKDTFTMDYKYPLSAFQAFALCLSSFDTKIACE